MYFCNSDNTRICFILVPLITCSGVRISCIRCNGETSGSCSIHFTIPGIEFYWGLCHKGARFIFIGVGEFHWLTPPVYIAQSGFGHIIIWIVYS